MTRLLQHGQANKRDEALVKLIDNYGKKNISQIVHLKTSRNTARTSMERSHGLA
jgi:hypothetical protein